MFRKMKPICPRCKLWKYCRFRFLNNKGRCKKLQPRYICTKCHKYFTFGGKLYNTSLNSPSNAPIIFPNRPCQVVVASPIPTSSCHQYGEAYSVNGFHTQPYVKDSYGWSLQHISGSSWRSMLWDATCVEIASIW